MNGEHDQEHADVGGDSTLSIAEDLARYLPAPEGDSGVHADIEEEQEQRGVASDGLEWSVVPAELVARLREVLEERLPDLEARADVGDLALDLAATAQDWQREQPPVYRGGVVL
ncbi:hypothetical protein [Streptomyces otsuchiensis]|uniref:hypothetical protein n=1 Tax=Streptomyces otsuchiensis TaxID=2681388 RepID=UPI00103196EF|nr:hypothetical protein [Streptomyces otsuchiensis]